MKKMIETLKDITSETWVVIILISAVVLLNIVYVYQDIISKNQIHGKITIILYGILIIFNQIVIDRQKSTIKRLCLNLLDEKVLKLEDLKKIREFYKNKKND